MAGISSDQDEDITGINVTPLVDVMLVLLVIFMVTANFISSKKIGMNLPSAETGETTASLDNKPLEFIFGKDKVLYLDTKAITVETMPGALDEYRNQNPGVAWPPSAVLTADEDTPHGIVVKLIDAIRKNGITDFSIAVEGP